MIDLIITLDESTGKHLAKSPLGKGDTCETCLKCGRPMNDVQVHYSVIRQVKLPNGAIEVQCG